MKLKKLKLVGFKSFADEVSLHFEGKIVAIVGPNGCGKSNIVDAFRWVLGEQSAKNLRGEKMLDVIFSGSEKRKPQNIAEVSLVLELEKGELSLPLDQITIGRRVYRSGESEYFLNKEIVRHKDIQHLLAGSGVGKNAFFLFEQGKLDELIYLSPQERRHIFDEASGISRFLQQKKETLRRLEQAKENFLQVSNIHAEVNKKRHHLKKQAEEANLYQAQKKELEELEKSFLVARLKEVELRGEKQKAKKDAFQEEIDEAKDNLDLFEKALSQLQKEFEESQEEVKAAQEKQYMAQNAVQLKEAALKREKEHALTSEKKLKALQKETQESFGVQESLSASGFKKSQESASLLKEKEKAFFELEEKKKELMTFERHSQELVSSERKAQSRLQELKNTENSLSYQFKEKKLRYDNSQEKVLSLKNKKEELLVSIKEKQGEKENRKKDVDSLLEAIQECKNELEIVENETNHLNQKIKENNQIQEKLAHQITEKLGRKKAILSLKESLEGFSKGAKVILKESSSSSSDLYGKVTPLYEYFDATSDFVTHVANALKVYASTMVVKTNHDLKLVLDFARKKNLNDISLIVEEDVTPTLKKELEKSSLSHHVKENSLALHFLKRIHVVDGLIKDHAQVLWQFGDNENTFVREAELKVILKELPSLEAEKSEVELQKKEMGLKRNALDEKKASLNEKRRKIEMDHLKTNFAFQQLQEEIKKATLDVESCSSQEKALQSTMETALTEINALNEKIVEVEKQKVEALHLFEKNEKELESALQKTRLIKADKEKCEKQYQEILFNWQQICHDLKVIEAKQEALSLQKEKQGAQETELIQMIEESTKKIALFELEKTTLSKQEKECVDLKKEKEKSSALLKIEKEKKEKGFLNEKSALSSLHMKIDALQEVSEKDQELSFEISKELEERFPNHDGKVSFNYSLEQAKKHIIELKYEIEKTKELNLSAIQDLEEEEKRFSDLDKQLKDLDSTKLELEKIMEKLGDECRKVFKTTFESIRTAFKKNYALLFKGGKADLKFTENTDLLEAGVEIYAEPPGKQMRALSLLSGGEKCLTAIALLFSIFEVRPAPFCILDEIDAPLDDANVGRFTEMLRQFTDRTQFIIVTHNKKTMAMADVLFGVSMEEKGVSKLLSLQFEKRLETVSV